MSSASSSRTSFDFAIDYLNMLWNRHEILHLDIPPLKTEVRLVKTFVVCARKWRNELCYMGHVEGEYERLGCILSRVQQLVSSITNDIHSASLLSGFSADGIWRAVNRFRERMKFLGTDIEELYMILVDNHCTLGNAVPDKDPQLLLDIIDSLLDIPVDLLGFYAESDYDLHDHLKDLEEKLMFLRIFVRFVTMQLQGGVEHVQFMHLLIYVEFVALNAARLLYVCWFHRSDEQVRDQMRFEISQLVHKKIMPADVGPQLRETYVDLLEASKLTKSSQTFSLEKNSHIVVEEFIDYLLGSLMDLLESCTSFKPSVHNQMKILYEAVTFLKKLFGEWQKKFNVLDDEMKDLIGVVVCDAGILIFSLSVNQMKVGLDKETDVALFHLLKVLKFIKAELVQIYPPKASSSFSFPQTNKLGSLDFLLENLKVLTTCEDDSIAFPKDQILIVLEDLVFLGSFLQIIVEQLNQNEELQALCSRIMEVAYKAEFVIDSMQVSHELYWPHLSLDAISKEIKFIKTEVSEIYDRVRHDSQALRVTKTYIRLPSQASTPGLDEVLVGLDEEVKTIIDGLTRGSMQLDIVSIVGMPGLGKTTLANRVYNDPSIMYHFHIRAWCTVSQVYSKHGLLHQILSDTISRSPKEYFKMNEDDFAEELYKRLKGNRYLIILDDVWDVEALNLLKESFPADENGSRILITSRSHILCSQFKFDSKPHHLRPLTDEESWELLQNKLFGKGCFPPIKGDVGMHIAKNCKGLPLIVVIVAGILASIQQDRWGEVAQSLSSSTFIGTEHCMKTLELSYKHLPDYLKSCLLYFGAFQEDQDIPVRRLLCLWIAEGFVQKTETKNLEDLADEYLMDLVARSLVMVTKQRSIGGVKACRIHDLLHEFCVAKAKEESFLQSFHGNNELFTSHRLRICSFEQKNLNNSWLIFPHSRSLISSFNGLYYATQHEYSCIFQASRLLRVLDFEEVYLGHNFPREIELLIHLRYLAIQCNLTSIPSGIANLSRLNTFSIVASSIHITLPNSIWNMKQLRHLCARSGFGSGHIGFILPIDEDDLESSPDFYHLETVTLAIDPSLQSMQKIMRKLPSIRRLKCADIPSRNSPGDCIATRELHFWSPLESLHVIGFRGFEFAFPLNLKKLTLSACYQLWSQIATIGSLPNLEVLKLLNQAFVGQIWEMKEGEFPNLRFLKLADLDIVRWTASCDNFPPLQKMVLHDCGELEDVPSFLGDIPTIEMIEVRWCHKSAVSLIKQIQEEQIENGNEYLKIIVQEEESIFVQEEESLSDSDSDS